jgi:cell wall-associated NlpC family hydrolase
MKSVYALTVILFVVFLQSCSSSRKTVAATDDTDIKSRVVIKHKVPAKKIDTKDVDADELVSFAESLQGVPYQYGSMDINKGFDCSGFINYVFNHYSISVPRTSADFTNAGKEVSIKECRRGDIILFTGSDAGSGKVGHMGIITKNQHRKITFVHAASGGGKGVVLSGMSNYFITRFVKVIRIFNFSEQTHVLSS